MSTASTFRSVMLVCGLALACASPPATRPFVIEHDVPRELRRGEAFAITITATPVAGDEWLLSGLRVAVPVDFVEDREVMSDPPGAASGRRLHGPWEVTLRTDAPRPMQVTMRGRVRADAPAGDVPIEIEAWRARRGDPTDGQQERAVARAIVRIAHARPAAAAPSPR